MTTYSLSPIASHSSKIDRSNINFDECSRLSSSFSSTSDIHHSVGFSIFVPGSSTTTSSSSTLTILREREVLITGVRESVMMRVSYLCSVL